MLIEGTCKKCNVGEFWAVFRRFGRALSCFESGICAGMWNIIWQHCHGSLIDGGGLFVRNHLMGGGLTRTDAFCLL